MTVAALYVETNGVYYGLPDVDPWDEARDARLYEGPWPVVAHPPCQRWSTMAHQVETRYGYRVGDDGGTFAAALHAVETFGGVLEHPAHSRAWDFFGLPEPTLDGWTGSLTRPGWSARVEQGHFAHSCAKPTWLYAAGVELPELPSGASDGRRDLWNKGGPLSEQQRKAIALPTPAAFRDVLLDMARSAATSSEGRERMDSHETAVSQQLRVPRAVHRLDGCA